MKKLWPEDLVDEIGNEINKDGIKGVNIKKLIVYASAFFNEKSDAMEEELKGTKDIFGKYFRENKMLKWVIIAILIPLWGLFIQSLFF